jgi:hypothetical protein
MDFVKMFVFDFLKRLGSKTPKFFQIVKTVSVILAVITGLPSFIESAGITLPGPIEAISSKVVSIAAIVAAFIAQLTVVPNEQRDLEIK